MKTVIIRHLLKVLFPFSSLVLFAQNDYEPFLVDGKVWYYETVKSNQYVTGKYYIDGDTVIAGKECKQLVSEWPGTSPNYIGALYEEERKVWMFNPMNPGKEPVAQLLYDFSCKEGDVLNVDLVTYGKIDLLVEKIDTVTSFGRSRLLITLINLADKEGEKDPGFWLEGVGSRRDMFSIWPVRPGAAFLSCEIKGEQTADQSSFGYAALPSDIRNISVDTAAKKTIHDLQGRRLKGVPQKGVYIQNGRKHVK